MIAIIDYDAGNIKSVEKALISLGQECLVTRDRDAIMSADKVILPGVGSFEDAMKHLEEYGLVSIIKEFVATGKPFMGICLGLQLIFDSSEESPGVKGLSLLPGKIVRIPDGEGLKIPHIGWNSIKVAPGKLFEGIDDEAYVYFVHSYYLKAENESDVAATTTYGVNIHAAVEHGNIYATQFHPEKSSSVGLKILQNFANL